LELNPQEKGLRGQGIKLALKQDSREKICQNLDKPEILPEKSQTNKVIDQ